MKILDCLPIPKNDMVAFVGTENVRLKESQIIVFVSVSVRSVRHLTPAMPRFPAILDTGHTHSFAIQQRQLMNWAGIELDALRPLGRIRHSGKLIPLAAANLWLHRNEPGTTAVSENQAYLFDLPTGIAVYPDDANYPRLPLLGLRAILSNQLHLTVDGENASVTLRTPDWRTRLFAWL